MLMYPVNAKFPPNLHSFVLTLGTLALASYSLYKISYPAHVVEVQHLSGL